MAQLSEIWVDLSSSLGVCKWSQPTKQGTLTASYKQPLISINWKVQVKIWSFIQCTMYNLKTNKDNKTNTIIQPPPPLFSFLYPSHRGNCPSKRNLLQSFVAASISLLNCSMIWWTDKEIPIWEGRQGENDDKLGWTFDLPKYQEINYPVNVMYLFPGFKKIWVSFFLLVRFPIKNKQWHGFFLRLDFSFL